jgi:transcriptional regulator with XRE-family HTH domain
MTQEEVAAAAGIDEFSASARISQYETGKHVPRYEIARNLAKALKVPVEYFYAADDRTAELLLLWSHLSVPQKTEVLVELRRKLAP